MIAALTIAAVLATQAQPTPLAEDYQELIRCAAKISIVGASEGRMGGADLEPFRAAARRLFPTMTRAQIDAKMLEDVTTMGEQMIAMGDRLVGRQAMLASLRTDSELCVSRLSNGT